MHSVLTSLLLLLCLIAGQLWSQDRIVGTAFTPSNLIGGGAIFEVLSDGTALSFPYTLPKGIGGASAGLHFFDSDGWMYNMSVGFAGTLISIYRVRADGSQPEKLFAPNSALSGIGLFATDMFLGSDGRIYVSMNWNSSPFSTGSIFSLEKDGSDPRILYSYDQNLPFPNVLGFYQALEGPDGKIYALATVVTGQGFPQPTQPAIVSISKDGSQLTILKTFPYSGPGSDYAPASVITFAPNGKIFGVLGNANGKEGLFSMNANGSDYQILYTFNSDPLLNLTELSISQSILVLHPNGKLYGTCRQGGPLNIGGIYSLNPFGGTFQIELFFQQSLGSWYKTSMRPGPDDLFYGSATDNGLLFSYNPAANALNILYDFDFNLRDSIGRMPTGSLLEGPGGMLYGFAATEGPAFSGTFFKIQIDGAGFDPFFTITSSPVGEEPSFGLTALPDGYRVVCQFGGYAKTGAFSPGTVFKVDESGKNAQVIKRFDQADGVFPSSGLVSSPDGYLYGLAEQEGPGGNGVAYRMFPDGAGYQVIHSFDFTEGGSPGFTPAVVQNEFFGIARFGGLRGGGFIFKVNLTNSQFTKLHEFEPATGMEPSGGLLLGQDGRLYGVCKRGGGDFSGVLYAITPTGNYSIVLDLKDLVNQSQVPSGPVGDLFQDSDGFLYAAIESGTALQTRGAIIRVKPNGQQASLVADFISVGTGSIGLGRPIGFLKKGSDGWLYGSARELTSGNLDGGGIFRVNPATGALEAVVLMGNHNPRPFVMETGALSIQKTIDSDRIHLYALYPSSYEPLGFSLQTAQGGLYTLTLRNLYGQPCGQIGLMAQPGERIQAAMPVHGIPAGVYLLEARHAKDPSFFKVVKVIVP